MYLRKRCPEHGPFEALVYGDAEAYISSAKFNKPGTIPLHFSTDIVYGCPHDCGLCPDHQQHVCVGIIEANTACNMDCPLCFADAGSGYNLALAARQRARATAEAKGQPFVPTPLQFSFNGQKND